MKKINDKTTVDRLFNGLLGEQGMWSLCKVQLSIYTQVLLNSSDKLLLLKQLYTTTK